MARCPAPEDLSSPAAGVGRHAGCADEGVPGNLDEVERNEHVEGTRERGEGPHRRAQLKDPLALPGTRESDPCVPRAAGRLEVRAMVGLPAASCIHNHKAKTPRSGSRMPSDCRFTPSLVVLPSSAYILLRPRTISLPLDTARLSMSGGRFVLVKRYQAEAMAAALIYVDGRASHYRARGSNACLIRLRSSRIPQYRYLRA